MCALQFRDHNKHQASCGNRTEQCPDCQKWVKLCDHEKHVVSNCQWPPAKVKPANTRLSDLSMLGGFGVGETDPAILSALLASQNELVFLGSLFRARASTLLFNSH